MPLLLLSLLLFPLFASAEYLGELSANPFDSASTSSPFGASSLFKSDGINNSYSPYGSPFSNQSATNPFTTDTPRLYDQEGHLKMFQDLQRQYGDPSRYASGDRKWGKQIGQGNL